MTEKILKLFKSEIKAINIGIDLFYKSLKQQGVRVVHVIWRRPPELEKEIEEILKSIL